MVATFPRKLRTLCRVPLHSFANPACEREPSNEPPLRQRYARPISDDEMVQQPDVDQRERLLHALRDELVGLAGFCNATGVIVVHDDRCGSGLEDDANHFARVHGCAVDRSSEEDLGAYEPMAIVEQK